MSAFQMANNQVQNVIKRVHNAAAVDECSDAAKRCRYDSFDQTDYGQKREESYMTMEVSNGNHDLLQDNGDMKMDVDSNSEHPNMQSAHEEQQQQTNHNYLQQQHHQQQQQQQQQASVRRRHASLSAQIYQDRNNDFNTMGHEYTYDFNGHFVGQKFDANNPTKIAAEFPETINDVEYMYQTMHGGDFMRHLMNSYPGEDL